MIWEYDRLSLLAVEALRRHYAGGERWTSCPHYREFERLLDERNKRVAWGWDANGSPVLEYP